MTNPVHTVGHSTRSMEAVIALLRSAGVDLLVDVRSFPRSRRNPQFNIETFPPELAAAGIGYRHAAALGGRRPASLPPDRTPNAGWREPGFRNYADYALGPQFREGLEELLADARTRQPAIMCAEAVWWQCHRRIITDYLLACGVTVRHIMDAGRIDDARLTPGAAAQPDGSMHYPPAQATLL